MQMNTSYLEVNETPVTFTAKAEDPSGHYDPVEKTATTEAPPELDILFPDHVFDGRSFAVRIVAKATGDPLAGMNVYLDGVLKGQSDADGKFTLTVGGTA